MKKTPFPTCPADVAPLTIHEFAVDGELADAPTLDSVCGRFVGDANRALVWLVRFRALMALNERAGMADWFRSGVRSRRDVCEVAAKLALNDRWEFDEATFCSAVDAVASKRSRYGA